MPEMSKYEHWVPRCEHGVTATYEPHNYGWRITHGRGGEAQKLFTDLELMAFQRPGYLHGRVMGPLLVQRWLDEVHAYEAPDEEAPDAS